MKKPVFAMLLGGALGVLDGLSALVSAPQTRPLIVGIVIGSTLKGVVAGAIVGLVAQRTQSVGILVGRWACRRRVLRVSRHAERALLLGDHPAWLDRRPHRRLCNGEISRPGH